VIVFKYEEILSAYGMDAVVDAVIGDCCPGENHQVVLWGHSLGAQVALSTHKRMLEGKTTTTPSCVLINPGFVTTYERALRGALLCTQLLNCNTLCPIMGYRSDSTHASNKLIPVHLIKSAISHVHQHPADTFRYTTENRVVLVSGLEDAIFPLPADAITAEANIKYIEGLRHSLPIEKESFIELLCDITEAVLSGSETSGTDYLRI
jgi:pimeloyl-ACP methyl ester carboxylesterase